MDLNMSNESLALNVFMYLCCAEDGKKEINFNSIQLVDENGRRNGTDTKYSTSIGVFNHRDGAVPMRPNIAGSLQNSLGTS